LALASETSNAKPYAIRGRFSYRKTSGIRRKRGYSGLFAVSGYRRSGFKAKIPQRNKALFKKIALLEYPSARRGDGLGGTKTMQWVHRIGISAAALAFSSVAASAAPTLTRSGLNMRAGPGHGLPHGDHRPRQKHGRCARMRCERLVYGSLGTFRGLHEPSVSRRNTIFFRPFSIACARRAIP
jgi:hypothetical protein